MSCVWWCAAAGDCRGDLQDAGEGCDTVNLPRALAKLGTPRRFKADGGQLFDCTACSGRGKLEVSFTKGKWYCHKCKFAGRFDQQHLYADITYIPGRPVEDLFPMKEHTAQDYYLREIRKLPAKLIEELRPHGGPSPVRVYLPVFQGDEIVWWTSRLMFDLPGVPRYFSPPLGATPKRKSEVLWGLHRHNQMGVDSSVIHLCEGIFDALWIPGALAMMGKSLCAVQVEQIKRLGAEIVIITLDGDARTEAGYLCKDLSRSFKVGWRRIPYGKDVDQIMRAGGKLPDVEWW